jgi:diketogulonate reductase-like aldo/keto reductase
MSPNAHDVEYKTLADTNVFLPAVGMGTWEYKGGVETLRRGIAEGATLIDTAEAYGTEEIVGKAIHGLREQVFLATKVLPRHFRRSDLLRAAENSLRRLHTDRIDLYQLHWPNYMVPIQETMGAMERLVDMGKVRFIGVSNFSAAELHQAQSFLSRHRIVSNQVPYSLINRDIEADLFPYCIQNRITIIAYSPLARGLDHIRRGDPKGALEKIARETGRTEAQVALNWCISKKEVIAIPKANNVGHMLEDLGASGWRLSTQQIRILEEDIKPGRLKPVEAKLRRFVRPFLQRLGRSQ